MSKSTSSKTMLSKKNRDKLASFFPLADTLGSLIGEHCEIVIHSVGDLDRSVVKIVNGHITGRKVGSPITDLGLKMLAQYAENEKQAQQAYFAQSSNGDQLKSATYVISDDSHNPIGLFCININMSLPFCDIIKTFMPNSDTLNNSNNEMFGANSTDVIQQSLQKMIAEVDNDPSIMPKQRNKEITKRLYKNGIFELKEATQQTADKLGISKHAIYKYIREFKAQ